MSGATSPEYSPLTDDDLVTGEAVALDLPAASLALRMASGLIDVIATILVLIGAVFLLLTAAFRTDGALLWAGWISSLVFTFVALPTAIETLTRGKSLGKWCLGLRTVRDDAGPISFQHALIRSLIGFVEVYAFTGAPAVVSAMVSAKGKRLGDHAAGTFVVRERVRLTLAPPPQMPPFLATWARTADVASLPPGLSVAVRQFLARAAQTSPHARHLVSTRLADAVREYASPAPPAGTDPEAFLAAVIAIRRDRDSARLAREDALRRRLLRH